MAQDNAAQAIKDLAKNLEQADMRVKSLSTDIQDYFNNLTVAITAAAQKSNVSIDKMFEFIVRKKGALSAEKIRLQFDIVKAKADIDELQKAIGSKAKSVTLFSGEEINSLDKMKTRFKQLQTELVKLTEQAKKTVPQMTEDVINMVNGSVGHRKSYSSLTRQRVKDEKEVQKIQEDVTKTLQRRKELEEQMAKYSPDSKSKKLRAMRDEWEQVNKQAQEYISKLGSLGTAGGRALKGFETAGLFTNTDKEQLAAERNYVNLLRERQQIEEKSLKLRLQLQNAQLAGKASPEFLSRSQEQLVDNAGRIAELEKRIQKERVQLTAEGQRRVEEMTIAHQNRLTNITNQGELSRQRIEARQLGEEEKKLAKEKAQAAKEAAKIQKQADSESVANQRRQIQIKSQLAAIDKNRIAITVTSSKKEKEAAEQQQADYKALQSELSKLISRQKELNGISQGSGSRARGKLSSYKISEDEKAMRRYADQLRRAQKEHEKLNKTAQNLLPTLQRIGYAFGIYFSARGLVQFGKKLVETRGEFEMQFVAMKQIIGDVDAATKIWGQTMQQALKSPFKAMQLVTYTKQLAAYRVETDKLFDTTKRLADVSAGLGVDMGRLILAYGQVKSANFLRASEVRQFTEAGVNIAGNLAKYFTELEGRAVSTAEVMERITKRMVSFADVEEIFKRMTDEGGEFFNMQEVQADTVRGQIMKLHDAYDQMLNAIGESKQGTIRNFVDRLNEMVRNWRDIVPMIKQTVVFLGSYIAVTKLARIGVQKFDDSLVRVRGAKKKQFVEMKASLVEESLLLSKNAKTITWWGYQTRKAIFNVQMAWKALGSVLKVAAPYLLLEGAIYAFNKIVEPLREAIRLRHDLENIRIENKGKSDTDVNNYDKLIHRFNELNRGSIERKEIIDKLNSQYGKYLGFIVEETTAFEDLNKAQERVNINIRERARLRAEEEAQQRIAEEYLKKEKKLLNPTQAWGVKDVYSFLYNDEDSATGKATKWVVETEKFADFVKTKIHDLTDEELKSRQDLINATADWLNTFYGVSGTSEMSKGLVDLVELYAEQEQKLRDERKKISEDLSGLPLDVQNQIQAMQSQLATAMQQFTKAGVGDEIEIPLLNIKFRVPTTLNDKNGIWETIKQEINRLKDDFEIQLKLNAGAITEDQANELREAAKTTGDIFVDEVNKEITKGILEDKGIGGSYSELVEQIFNRQEEIRDWKTVNDAIELIKKNLISSSDIVNGISSYTKELSANLANGRQIIDEAVKKQNLIVDGTAEEVEKAQEAVDKAKERYKWLLRIAKLLGIDTKAADEIVEEQGYDLSVGQFRLAAAQSAFMEKFGKESNTYGKQLKQIGVTENLKDVADAYHKQSEELDGLIKNQKTALKNESNLTEEQKENAKATIENLTEQKSMAEFLAEFFGYVPKKTTTRTTHENASKLISLIKEMRGEYDKLSKSAYGYAKSEDKVRESYRDSVKEILGKAGITDYDFTTNEGMIKALEKVKSYATKLGKDAAAEVQKYIDQLETEIEINAQVRIREDFGRQIEDMFNNYELTLELQKLNIPADAAKDLFPDFKEKTLGDLQKRLREFYEERQKKDEKGNVLFSEEDLKEYRKWADKIDTEILKERKEKAKEYSKYLEKEYSERAKLEMQHAKDVAFVTANVVDDNQRKTILANIEKKYQDDLNELKWKSFKESSFYVDMMDDIASLPAEYTRMMLDKINEILEHPEKLSPRALKEAVNARQKVIEAQIATKPLTVMTNAGKEIREARKLLKQDEEITVKWWESTRRALDKQIKTEAESIAKDEEKINSLQGLQGELAGYERLLENLKEATSKVDREGLNKLMGIDLGKSVSELSPEEIEDKIEELKTLLDSQISLYDATEKTDEQNARAVEIEQIEKLIETLRGELEARKALASFNLSKEAKEALGAGETSSTIGSQISGIETSKGGKQKRLTTWKEYRKQFKNFSEAFADFNKNLNEVLGKVRDMGNAWYDMFDALGGETNVLTDGWKEFGNTITDVFTQTLTLIPQMIVAFQAAGTSINASLGVIGLIAEAVQLVFVAIGAFAKLHDARYEREIEIQQKKIDDLQRAYDRLEKSIEKAFDMVSYIREYNQEVQNLNEQYEALANQIDAEKAKKNVDEDKLQDYADKQQEIIDNLEEIKQQQIEVFGGIGEEGYRDAAQGFVDAWKSAFLETGDGLQGLQDHFDEFLNDWFVKQATMRIAANNLAPLFQKIDQAVGQYGDGGANVTWQELQEINDLKDLLLEQTNEQLKELAGVFGLGGEGSLSGLAAGIQGMTEEQANILEAYWNSVRGYTASIDANVATIVGLLSNGAGKGDISGGVNYNPMLQQITLVEQNTKSINALLQSVTRSGHSMGGQGIKVFVN